MALMPLDRIAGQALDWATAKSLGWAPVPDPRELADDGEFFLSLSPHKDITRLSQFRPSSDPAQAFAILREGQVEFRRDGNGMLDKHPMGGNPWKGDSYEDAGMRCFVAFHLGEYVEIPDSLAAPSERLVERPGDARLERCGG